MIKQLSHIFLSVVMLLSATGMTINMHFCQGHLYDLALIAPAHDCCEIDGTEHSCDGTEDSCHHNHEKDKSHQCDDESIRFESTNDYFVSSHSFDFENSYSHDLFFSTLFSIENPKADDLTVVGVLNYKRPPPQEVVLSHIQSFLI